MTNCPTLSAPGSKRGVGRGCVPASLDGIDGALGVLGEPGDAPGAPGHTVSDGSHEVGGPLESGASPCEPGQRGDPAAYSVARTPLRSAASSSGVW